MLFSCSRPIAILLLTFCFTTLTLSQSFTVPERTTAPPSASENAQPPATSAKIKLGTADYEQALARDPGDILATNNLGALYFKSGRQEDGLRLMKKAADAAPGIWDIQLNVSIALTQMDQLDDALIYARRAEAAKPEALNVRRQLCSVYLAKKMTEAVKCFAEVSKDQRADVMDVLGYGQALVMTKDLVTAEKVMLRAVDISPYCAMAYNDLGVTAYRLKKYSEAVNAMREAVRLEPDNGRYRFTLGVVQLAMGDRTGAISEYRLLKTSDPERAERLFQLIFAKDVVVAGH